MGTQLTTRPGIRTAEGRSRATSHVQPLPLFNAFQQNPQVQDAVVRPIEIIGAKRIFYSWGAQQPENANSLVRRLGCSEAFIKIESLFEAFKAGLEEFGTILMADAL